MVERIDGPAEGNFDFSDETRWSILDLIQRHDDYVDVVESIEVPEVDQQLIRREMSHIQFELGSRGVNLPDDV